jgi:hypothetical protein
MKKFIINCFLFFGITFFVLHVQPLYLLINNAYQKTITGFEVYTSILKSNKKNKSKKIIIGDSVGRQLFSNEIASDSLNSLACNQAISLAGQYFLLFNYLTIGNRPDTIFLIYSPFSFGNNLNEIYTYHNFVKPFYNKQYKPLMDSLVLAQINKIPYLFASNWPIVYTGNWAPEFKSNDTKNYTFLSPISVDYLIKIKKMLATNNITLIILPPYLSEAKRNGINNMNIEEANNAGLQSDFINYFSQIKYLPDSCFVDGSHLKRPDLFNAAYKQLFLH